MSDRERSFTERFAAMAEPPRRPGRTASPTVVKLGILITGVLLVVGRLLN